jgi:medium-chain acyl-[acyl-carrier-protein] hydrolase
VFASWQDRVPPTIEVLVAQLPGHGARIREPLFTSHEPLVAAAGPALLAHIGDAPFAFLGHSLGTVVAFELARWLRRQGERLPICLIMAGRRAPHLPGSGRMIHKRSDAEIVAELERTKGTPAAVLQQSGVLELTLPIIRADYQIVETYEYRHEPPLPCAVTVLGGVEDPETTTESLSSWRAQSSGPFALHFFLGGHFFIHTHCADVLPRVCQILEAAAGGGLLRE